MQCIASGSAFPIATFYISPNVYNINEASIISSNPQNGSKICYAASGPIKLAAALANGSIFFLEGLVDSVLLNPRTGTIKRNAIEPQVVADVLAISSAGDFVVLGLSAGNALIYKLSEDGLKFIKNIESPKDRKTNSLLDIGACMAEGRLIVHRHVSKNLDSVSLSVDILMDDFSLVRESHQLPGIKVLQLSTAIILDADRVAYLAVDDDCICYTSFQITSGRLKSSVFKIRNRPQSEPFSCLMRGSSFNLNDSSCPSFLLFGPGSESVMGIVYAETIKFWNISCQLEDVQSGIYAEDSSIFYCSSKSKAAFLEMDAKALKLSMIQYADSFFPFSSIVSKHESNALLCLSTEKDFIYKLGAGIYLKNRLCSEPLFKGVDKLWSLKSHFLDYCPSYILCSTLFGSLLLSIEDSTASDVTGLIGIDRNEPTLCAFNVLGSSYVVHVTPAVITAFDFSKIDSANSDVIKSQVRSSSTSVWTLVCYHQLLMACSSKGSKSISFFQIKNRPRDLDVIVPHGTVDCTDFLERGAEICSISVYSASESIFLSVATDGNVLILLELNLDLSPRSQKRTTLSAPVSFLKFYPIDAQVHFSYGCRDGTWFSSSWSLFPENSYCAALGRGPLSALSFMNDMLIVYSDFGANVLSLDSSHSVDKKREFFDWTLSSACEFVHRPEEPWIAGIENDCLVMMAFNRSKLSSFSKKVIFNNAKITCFDQEDPAGNWIIGHEEVDGKNQLGFFSSSGQLLFSFDEGGDEPVSIIRHSRADTIIVMAHSKSMNCSKLQIFTVFKDKFEIVSEFICSGFIKKAVFSSNCIFYSLNEDLGAVEVCPNFLNFPRRASFHFRNKILDFDVAERLVAVSTLSDGLDILGVVVDEENFNLKHLQGDAFSRSCLACLWITPGQRLLYTDKNGLVGFVKIEAESKFLIEDKNWRLNETGTSLFKHGNDYFVQTISGSIIKIEE